MTPTEVRHLLAELDLRPSKALGQNFLIDGNILEILAREADIRATETVLEIGPGLGALTRKLADRAAKVIAIEKDGRLAEFIRRRYPEVTVIHGDACAAELPACDKVVANLPYSISSAMLERFVEAAAPPRRLVLTVQKEVALRLAATPRHKDYGALTLFTQLRYHVTIVHIVSPQCFLPAPNVDSAIVALDRREPRVPLAPGAPFHALVRQGFQQRRKMLRKLLGAHDRVDAALANVGAVPTARAEELSLEQWIGLANALRSLPAPAPRSE
jgi:16S rRNA (adenine1518-N6/adenine1519-N6)-dimethyltransferase